MDLLHLHSNKFHANPLILLLVLPLLVFFLIFGVVLKLQPPQIGISAQDSAILGDFADSIDNTVK